MAFALVIEATELWIGNEDFEPDPIEQYQGHLKHLRVALDAQPLAPFFPPGSKGTVIGYSTGAKVIVPLGPIENLTSESLGTQRDYDGQTGENLVDGIDLAVHELAKVDALRRVVVVIGTGEDSRNAHTVDLFAAGEAERASLRIELNAMVFGGADEYREFGVARFVPSAKTINSVDGVRLELREILEKPQPTPQQSRP